MNKNLFKPLHFKAASSSIIKNSSNGGSIMINVLITVPLALCITFCLVELTNLYAFKSNLQSKLDNITYMAGSHLDDEDRVRAIVISKLQERTSLSEENIELFEITPGSKLILQVKASYAPKLSRMMKIFSPSYNPKISIEARSIVHQVPQRTVLIISNSNQTAPSQANTFSNWDAAEYFNAVNKPVIYDSSGNDIVTWGSQYLKWATQTCFNPILSTIKYAAISIVDQLELAEQNSFGVIFTPGSNNLVSTDLDYKLDGTAGKWNPNFFSSEYLGDEVCALIDKTSDIYNLEASIKTPLPVTSNNSCPNLIDEQVIGADHNPTSKISNCYLKHNLLARELIYWKSANQLLDYDLSHALGIALSNILSHNSLATKSANEVTAQKSIIAVVEKLPDPDDAALIGIIENIVKALNSLTIIAYSEHTMSSAQANLRENRLNNIIKKLVKANGNKNFRYYVRNANSLNELYNDILPKAIHSTRQLNLVR